MSCKDIFDDIYRNKVWGEWGAGSGEGSDPLFTRGLVTSLKHIIDQLDIKSMLDVSCGAGKWIPRLLAQLPHDFKYVGVDVSPIAAQSAAVHCSSFDNAQIAINDLTQSSIPGQYDLVLCRDTLQHMSNSDIHKSLANLLAIDTKWYAIGSYPNGANESIETGKHNFLINLADAPFNLTPDWMFGELHTTTYYNKHLYLYKKETLTLKYKHTP